MASTVEDQWRRDLGKIVAWWLIGSAIAVGLLLTVVKGFFV